MRIVLVGGDDLATDWVGVETVAGERPATPWDWFPHGLPLVGLQFDAGPPRVWFGGRPIGFQRQALEQILDDAARGGGPVSPLVRSTVAAIETLLDLAILTVPSWPHCAQAVRLAGNLAREQRALRVFAVALNAVPELASTLAIRGVPVLLAGSLRHEGPVSEWVLAQLLERAARPES